MNSRDALNEPTAFVTKRTKDTKDTKEPQKLIVFVFFRVLRDLCAQVVDTSQRDGESRQMCRAYGETGGRAISGFFSPRWHV